jgi:hypothetical protein
MYRKFHVEKLIGLLILTLLVQNCKSRVWTPERSVAEALEHKRQALDPNSAAEQWGIIPSAFGGVVRLTNFSSLPRLTDTAEVITYKVRQLGRVIKI